MPTANDEKIKNLNHALKHLTANKINQKDQYGGSWYCGDKDKFIRRHNKSIAYLRDLLSKFAESNTPIASPPESSVSAGEQAIPNKPENKS